MIDLPINSNIGLFEPAIIISEPFKQTTEMETNTLGYFYNQYTPEVYFFDFVNNPLTSTLSKIDRILNLNYNWDGYNAVPVFPKAGRNAKNLVDTLDEVDVLAIEQITDIYPTTHGTITLEWEKKDKSKMSLEIGSNSYSYFVLDTHKAPILADGKNIFSDLSKITDQIANFIRENVA